MLKHLRNGRLGALVVVSALGLALVGCSSSDDKGDNPITGADVTPPAAPAGVVATAIAPGSTEFSRLVEVSWAANAEDDLAGYNVYWTVSPNDDQSYEYLGFVPDGTVSYQDEKPESYVFVHYRVTAVDDAQNESERSDAAIVRVAPTGAYSGGQKHLEEQSGGEPGS